MFAAEGKRRIGRMNPFFRFTVIGFRGLPLGSNLLNNRFRLDLNSFSWMMWSVLEPLAQVLRYFSSPKVKMKRREFLSAAMAIAERRSIGRVSLFIAGGIFMSRAA